MKIAVISFCCGFSHTSQSHHIVFDFVSEHKNIYSHILQSRTHSQTLSLALM